MATTIGTEYDHIDITNGVGTIRHPLKDSTTRELAQNLIKVQDTQPESDDNVLWVKETPDNEVEVPTYDEFNELKSVITDSHLVVEITPTFDWEAGGINNSGQERSTANNIRTDFLSFLSTNIHVDFNGSYYDASNKILFNVVTYNEIKGFQSIVGYADGSHDITVPSGYYVRFTIKPASGSASVPLVADANAILQVSCSVVQNVTPDKTLTAEGLSADAKATGDAINSAVSALEDEINEAKIDITDAVHLIWQKGNISSTGTNSQSASTVVIRVKDPTFIDADKFNYVIPDGYTAKICVYTVTEETTTFEHAYSGLTQDGVFVFEGVGRYIRMTLQKTSGENIDLSEGDQVLATIKTDGRTVLNKLFTDATRNALESYTSFSIFQKFGVVGDSFASGSLHHPDDGGWTGNYDLSWPQILARQTGTVGINFTKGGLSTKTWLENTAYGLAKLLDTAPQQLYIIALGINDNTQINAGTLTLGTIEDVNLSDYTQNPDTFFGNYGRIIGNIKAHAPYAKIVCLSVARPNERNMDEYIEEIANKCEVPFIDLTSDPYFTSVEYYGSMVSSHPIAYGYGGMATAIERLIKKNIMNNTAYWGTYYGLVDADTSGDPDE